MWIAVTLGKALNGRNAFAILTLTREMPGSPAPAPAAARLLLNTVSSTQSAGGAVPPGHKTAAARVP